MRECPPITASVRGVLPLASSAFMLAPCWIKYWATCMQTRMPLSYACRRPCHANLSALS